MQKKKKSFFVLLIGLNVDQVTSEVLCLILGNSYVFLPLANIYQVPTLCQAPFFYAQSLEIKQTWVWILVLPFIIYIGQDRLGFAAETINPKISVAYPIPVLFLIYAACPPWVGHGSTPDDGHSRTWAASILGFMAKWESMVNQALALKASARSDTYHVCSHLIGWSIIWLCLHWHREGQTRFSSDMIYHNMCPKLFKSLFHRL